MKLSSWILNHDRWCSWNVGEDDIKSLGLADSQPGPWHILQQPAQPSDGPAPQCVKHTAELCFPSWHTLFHQDWAGSRCVSCRDQSQHTDWVLPNCLQQFHLANNNTETNQILIKSRFSVHWEARRHFPTRTHTILTGKWQCQNCFHLIWKFTSQYLCGTVH